MERPSNYHTKQREAILSFISSLEGYATAAQIIAYFENQRIAVGRTTVYRHLEKLEKCGKIRKYTVEGVSGACYENVGRDEPNRTGLRLKCVNCGRLFRSDCDMLRDIQEHISARHDFQINTVKTIFYGNCLNCGGTIQN